jgi:membrane protein required for colicin V production
MNWLDILLLVLLGLAAYKGFRRGFIIEVAALAALVLGIWAGVHVSDRVAVAIGLPAERTALAFLVTFLLVLLVVHLLARFLTSLINITQLGLFNKLAGIAFGALRAAFVLSVLLNVLGAASGGELPPADAVERSRMHGPLRGLAPAVVPVLGETKWVVQVVEQLKEQALQLWDGAGDE